MSLFSDLVTYLILWYFVILLFMPVYITDDGLDLSNIITGRRTRAPVRYREIDSDGDDDDDSD